MSSTVMPVSRTAPSDTRSPTRALLARLHFYAGLFVAPFIVLAAASGALYALAPSAEQVLYSDYLTTEPTGTEVPLADQVTAARDHAPDLPVTEVWPATTPGETTRVLVDDPTSDEDLAVFVDPGTGEVLGQLSSYSGLGELPLRSWISSLHQDLHLGDAGAVYSELAASWLLVLIVSGTVVWILKVRAARRAARRRSDAPEPRVLRGIPARPGSSQRTLSVHAVIGTWLSVILLGLAATGLTWSTYAGSQINSVVEAMDWRTPGLETALDPAESAPDHGDHAGHPGHGDPGATDVDPTAADRVRESARSECLAEPLRLLAPADADSAWEAHERWVPWRLSSDALAVDGSDGRVVDRLDFADHSLYSKLSSWGIYLHMGILFGLPLQIALFATAVGVIVLAVLGYVMWWRRRPTAGGFPSALGSLRGHRPITYVVAGAVALALGVAFPLLGVSLVGFLLVDVLLSRSAARSGR